MITGNALAVAEEWRDSLRDERHGDGVLHQNWQGDHLAELHCRGVHRPAEGLLHGEPPGAPGHLLQELTLRGHGCRQAERGRERERKVGEGEGDGSEREREERDAERRVIQEIKSICRKIQCVFFRWGDEL